jgi:magnesium-transporting ATPase (P-type)
MVTGDNLKTATAIADKAGIFRTGDIAMEVTKITATMQDAGG